MSGYLWKYYLEDDVDSFRHVLTNTTHTARAATHKASAGWQGGGHGSAVNGSPGSYNPSPMTSAKSRKMGMGAAGSLNRSDINSRDAAGMTILHHAASSLVESAVNFAQALLEHPWTDVYIQDAENGWTALHRAFYFGNIAIARLILNRDSQDILGHGSIGFNQHARGLVKIKDKEGYGPLDLFAMTIKDRTLRPEEAPVSDADSDDEMAHGDSGDVDEETRRRLIVPPVLLGGDEVFTFGSNKNVTLGFGDEDDRQYPERITIRRPDHLLQRFYREHRERQNQYWAAMGLPAPDLGPAQPKGTVELPTHVRNTPIVIQDVRMSKLHTAVLTTDPVSNLYMCGHGPGGRLGTGSETTRYQFTCIEGGGLGQKKVAAVALGQNHTLAITEEGEIYSWGNNAYGQLGYTLPKPTLKDDDPISTIPRQIFGPLKREIVAGVSASRIHSVVHTTTSLYTFGKNEGQLGIVDSDARSLEMQTIPRKIAAALFSSPIHSVSAIDGATICLLENREVWVFANYGYAKVNFPLEGFTSNFLKESWLTTKYDTAPNKVKKITSGGDTICALTTSGEIFTVAVSRRTEGSQDTTTSTTNPKQIRGALSVPYRIWSSNKSHMAARDVDVDQDGSVILTTEVGSVWRRTKRATIKNAATVTAAEARPHDFKFQRVSGLTRVTAVRASAFGAYAAIRKDCDVTRNQIGVDEPNLWDEISPLLSFYEMTNYEEDSDDDEPEPRFWRRSADSQGLRKRALKSKDLETEIAEILQRPTVATDRTYNMEVCTTTSEVRIPVHELILAGRSRVFRDALLDFRLQGTSHVIPDLLTIRSDGARVLVQFQGLDFLAMFNFVLYLYTDSVVDFWNVTRHYPTLAYRYRTIRTELMKVASRLELRQLEPAVRQMVNPRRSLHMDMELAMKDQSFFESGDVVVDLADGEMLLHSDLICQRCPFFEGLFRGRAGGQWLAGRRTEDSALVHIDLTHVETHLFKLVVRHLYTDAGEEIFEDVTSEDLNDLLALDELLDHVMDVMSVANELMLDRLTQICQRLIGRYVNARNVCSLLTAIAPSSVAEFKDAALEYVCLSLEAVMQNGSLDELDDDLLLELNQVARDNQLAYLPFARSGRAEAMLFDRYPELVERIERSKRSKIDAIVLSNKYADGDNAAASFRAQSLEEVAASPLRQRNRRRASKEAKSPALTPALKGKNSVQDLMFEMSDGDEDDDGSTGKKIQPLRFAEEDAGMKSATSLTSSPKGPWAAIRRQNQLSPDSFDLGADVPVKSLSPLPPPVMQPVRTPGRPWGAAPLVAAKLDLKDIMAQDSSATPSNLSLGLSRRENERIAKAASVKMSQKERKRLQQAQQLGTPAEKPTPTPPAVSPWQVTARKPSNRPIVLPIAQASPIPAPAPSRTFSTPQLTMRQTVANKNTSRQKDKRAASSTGQSGAPSSPARPAANERGMSVSTDPIPAPRSVRHIPLPQHDPTSPSQNLSMMEILSLQAAEKVSIRDAAAKRSLQEIQQEQEFQAWWDQESRRAMEEEAQAKRAAERAAKASGRGKAKSREGGRGGKAEGRGTVEDKDGGKGSGNVGADKHQARAAPRQEGGERADKRDGDRARGGRGRIGRGGRGGGTRAARPQGQQQGEAGPAAAPPVQRQTSAAV
ncbi:similar to BTB domain and ankyrin repeat protein [Plenodomus lingam JN3]|uniref:Similar to BTB domain and ankyrin repeat protein n=1 Tax=Leptosphaeria maculans (strain JN3 / isolate v23.1.3 / race Av1-4-5-6-7-8) TaxID=985895 RepID=E5AEW3_LEPMJ|nr:similar to BTB domain and ankyrin repeat protein [Plenodomus lingam JN3]CBY01752.1 similar to BTB domain and ankyrin repeat protein [Plenodomus lingam JN3]